MSAVERVAVPIKASHSPLEGSLANFGKTVASINEIGTEAARLFRTYIEQRQKVEEEHGIKMEGGIDPHMVAALDSYLKAQRAT